MSDDQVKFTLGERDIPTHWVKPHGRYRSHPPRPAAAAPRDEVTRGARRPVPPLPDGADPPGGLGRARGRDPRAGARGLQALAPHPAVPRPPARARARHPRPHLLQVRGRLAAGVAQAEHRGRPGLRERPAPGSRSSRPRRAPASGALRWPSPAACSGWSARCGWSARATTRSPIARSMMETWGATVHRSPSDLTESGPLQARPPDRLARDRNLRGGRGGGAERRHQLLARLGAQPRAAAPDGDRAGGAGPDGDGRRGARRRRRLRRRRLELRRPDVPVPAPRASAARHAPGSSPPSRPRARRSPAASTRTTSATPSG